LEEHKVVEESITSMWHEEEEVHRVGEDSFKSLHEDRARAWLKAKNKGMKAVASPQIPVSSLDNAIREV
jgi:hypothetical protein